MQVNGSVVPYNVVVGSVVVDLMFIVAPIMGVLFFPCFVEQCDVSLPVGCFTLFVNWCLVNAPL